uniref:Polyprotein protein n=1 Tax=Solanum tuberosum TaxID=4113 RepID=M1DLU9_SOLTU
MDYLKSTHFPSLFDSAEDPNAPANFEMPPTKTVDVHMDVVVDWSEMEMDVKLLDAHEEAIYEDLPDLEKMIVHLVIQKSMAGSTGASVAASAGTDAKAADVTPGIDATTDGATV